jgi:hypothetical protein
LEDIKHAADSEKVDVATKKDARSLIQFFHQIPENVKVLATSRIALGWPKEEIIKLDGLKPQDGMQVFKQWVPDHLEDVDDNSAMEISHLAGGHPLSIRLIGGSFNNCVEPISEFIDNFNNRLSEASDYLLNERYDSVDTCIQWSYGYLDDSLQSLIGKLRLFQTPFSATLAMKILKTSDNNMTSTSSANHLHKLWQQSWLNEVQYDSTLGDWCPKFIEKDTKFFTFHPQVHDFLNHKFGDIENEDSAISSDPEIQFYTALCYGVGFGVVIDSERQIEWCTKAAKNGHLEAQLTLAIFHEQESFNWCLKAAERGNKRAQQQLATRYPERYNSWRNSAKAEPLEIKFDITLPQLHRAAENNKLTLVRSLVKQPSVNMEARDRYGRTPLYISAEKGYMVVEFTWS